MGRQPLSRLPLLTNAPLIAPYVLHLLDPPHPLRSRIRYSLPLAMQRMLASRGDRFEVIRSDQHTSQREQYNNNNAPWLGKTNQQITYHAIDLINEEKKAAETTNDPAPAPAAGGQTDTPASTAPAVTASA